MSVYYHLRVGSRKDRCPQCEHKTFVPFVDTEGAVLTDQKGVPYGRCDRESKCGFFASPKQGEQVAKYTPPLRPPQPMMYFDTGVLTASAPLYANTLANYLMSVGDKDAGRVVSAFERYKVATNDTGACVFWQIDCKGVVRSGKVIEYDTQGHRRKDVTMPATWAHKVPAYATYKHEGELVQCFFGEHLLTTDERPVAVVESEKTALILSMYEHNYLWLACGGAQMLKNDNRLSVLKGRAVTLFPDNGQFYNWQATARKYGWDICSVFENEEFVGGKDIADFLIDIVNKMY